ncbi:hypothetical protein PVL29_005052 [Vitis rotundifolia]|nr:hypothetical protein PVL29_005052 [Vitis rotundifolia]
MPAVATRLFSFYASLQAFIVLIRTMINELIPDQTRTYVLSKLQTYWFAPPFSQLTLLIEEDHGMTPNEIYYAIQAYLDTKIPPSAERLKVGKTPGDNNLNVTIAKGQEVPDSFQNIRLKWVLGTKRDYNGFDSTFELSFDKKYKEIVLQSYLPHIIARANDLKVTDKVLKLYSRSHTQRGGDDSYDYTGDWGFTTLKHPATFDTMAMDPELKKAMIDDLNRFVARKEYYKRVGKPWKRGYLLYGPPGTGKSSLIAAMANYLKFDIYHLELNSIRSDNELKQILVSTTSKSMIVIEDIDCNAETRDRGDSLYQYEPTIAKLTLSGILNFTDGLWSSCGEQRIIVFTTNHKDLLDPALLRPGRMDMQIYMSYCTYDGFKTLASNYLGVTDHPLFGEIETLLKNTEVTPAEIGEEFMRSDDADVALGGLVEFINRKKIGGDRMEMERATKVDEGRENDDESEGIGVAST